MFDGFLFKLTQMLFCILQYLSIYASLFFTANLLPLIWHAAEYEKKVFNLLKCVWLAFPFRKKMLTPF